ncbi:MAG: siderophore ABC transporter substrate-binding protein [Tissierellia bacterium]|nr:siderophore ABC transporter substrate-binding protein [Tissierellia bacterium]
MFKKKSIILFLVLILSIAVLAGCSNNNTDEKASSQDTDSQLEEETFPIEHALGRTEVKRNPERVIVFDYAALDSLDKMGVEILGLPKSNIPEYLSKFNDDKYEDVGTLFEPDFEKIYELNPDVIFISGRQTEVYEELNKIAPTVFLQVDGADYLESVNNNMKLLGQIFDKEEIIDDELAKINSEIEKINKEVKEKGIKALVVLANDGSISAFGEGSRFGVIYKEFGFVPADPHIEVSKHGQNVNFEYILEKNPDYVFVIDRAATTGGNIAAEQIFDNDIIKETDAYKNERIVYLTSQIWYVASGGLQGTNMMIEDIQQALD